MENIILMPIFADDNANGIVENNLELYRVIKNASNSVIFNEIRAFNDHISRCYMKPDNKDWIDTQIRKSESHIERIILDCYKFLNVSLYDKVIKDFDRRYKGVDLSCIDNGDFIIRHKKLSKEIVLVSPYLIQYLIEKF